MIAIWVALGVAVVALAGYAAFVSRDVVQATWPGEAPLHVRENRAHDQQVGHLERLIAAEDPSAAHQVVRDVTAELLETSYLSQPRLPTAATSFLAAAPRTPAERYRRELAEALRRIEDL